MDWVGSGRDAGTMLAIKAGFEFYIISRGIGPTARGADVELRVVNVYADLGLFKIFVLWDGAVDGNAPGHLDDVCWGKDRKDVEGVLEVSDVMIRGRSVFVLISYNANAQNAVIT